MCGITGIWSPSVDKNLALLPIVLQFLLRRGAEGMGAGFINPKSKVMVSSRANSQQSMEHFPTRIKEIGYAVGALMTIGQTRYITDDRLDSKALLDANTQPIELVLDKNHAMGVHNGAVREKHALAAKISPRSEHIADVDTRFVIEYFMQMRRKHGKWKATKKTIEQLLELDAAASVVFSAGRELIAFRDAKGYRPLSLGRINDSLVLCSESAFFDEMASLYGYDEVEHTRQLKPGEMIHIDEHGTIESRVLVEHQKTGPCRFEDIYIKAPNSQDYAYQTSCRSIREDIGIKIAKFYKDVVRGIDFVAPAPNSGKSYAHGFSWQSGILYRDTIAKPFFERDARYFLDFKSNKRHKYVIDSQAVRGKNIAIIDDSIVRGSTLTGLYAQLKDAGANRVVFFSAWPPKFFHCDYGVDTNDKELIAYQLIREGIAKYKEGKCVEYDIHAVNKRVTEIARERVRSEYGNKYNGAKDLEIYYATLAISLGKGPDCNFCVTGVRA